MQKTKLWIHETCPQCLELGPAELLDTCHKRMFQALLAGPTHAVSQSTNFLNNLDCCADPVSNMQSAASLHSRDITTRLSEAYKLKTS